MKLRFSINLSIWIGLWSGIYVALYQLSPLAPGGVMACSFVALPIFLNGGAKIEEYFDYCSSAISGVVWAIAFIISISFLISNGINSILATTIVVALATTALCAVHFIFTNVGLFSKIPMMFGSIASTFFAGMEKWPYIMITLCLGITLGYINNSGAKLLDSKGKWIFFTKKETA